MVKVPEKFLAEYLSREKGVVGKSKSGTRLSTVSGRKVSDEERSRLKQNLQVLWGIYCTPEIKEILSRKRKIRLLNIESNQVCLNLSYVDKGVLMEYESDMGVKKELAGARIYKQAEIIINRYFTYEKGLELLLKTTNSALRTLMDILTEKELLEMDIWNAIEKRVQINISMISHSM